MTVCVSIVPVDSDKEQGLPQLQVEGLSWSLWWHTVREVAQSRPGLETIVVSAFIIATHDLQCEYHIFQVTHCLYYTKPIHNIKC